MDKETYEKLVEKICNDFFLVRKRTFYYFVGGILTALLAIFGITAETFFDELETSVAATARTQIQTAQAEAIASARAITDLEAELRLTLAQSNLKPSNKPPGGPLKSVQTIRMPYISTTAYWSKGTNKKVFKCGDLTPPKGFELVLDTVDERVLFRSPSCAVDRNYCDSHGEYCVDQKVRVACFINSEWHDWYKEFIKNNNLRYSKDSVCMPPKDA